MQTSRLIKVQVDVDFDGGLVLFIGSRRRRSFNCSGFVCDLIPHTLKGNFTQTRKFSHYLLTLMLREGQMSFRRPTKHLWSVTAKQLCSILLNPPKKMWT